MAFDRDIQALVLAGGLGTRLAPYTIAFPKPLVPLGDMPILEIVLRQLRWYGLSGATISVGHLAALIEAYFAARGGLPGFGISYLRETKPLGTAGALGLLGETAGDILVVNGDVLTTLDFAQIIRFHQREHPALTIAVHPKEVTIDLGVLQVDDGGQVQDYIEKPTARHLCSMGVYLYSPEAVRAIGPGERLDFPDLVLRLLDQGERVLAYPGNCYWLDIGRREDYERAAAEFEGMRSQLLPDEKTAQEGPGL